VRYIDGNGSIWPGVVVVGAAVVAGVMLFWLLVIGHVVVVLWALVAALFGR